MIDKSVKYGFAVAALAWTAALEAHHSISMFDISTSIWVKGTVVAYQPVNPHATIQLEATQTDGSIKRWTIEGPHLGRIARMGAQPEVGDVIEVCGFALKDEISRRGPSSDPYGISQQFVHGHLLLMADGHWELFGAYGSLAECIGRSDVDMASWLEFLDNADPSVHDLWCGQLRSARARQIVASDPGADPTQRIDEINGLLRTPCK